MVRIKLEDIFIIILIIILIIGSIYGTYLLYSDSNHKNDGIIEVMSMLVSVMTHFIVFAFICMLIRYLSEKTLIINTTKIKEKLKQLIK